jgi:hypothetical protein
MRGRRFRQSIAGEMTLRHSWRSELIEMGGALA